MSPSASIIAVPARIPVGAVFVLAFALFAMLPARADVRIVSSPGGAVDAYLSAFARIRQLSEVLAHHPNLRNWLGTGELRILDAG